MSTPDSDRRAAERWFLDRGLPSVLTRRAKWRALWQRSAPVLAGCSALTVVGLGITVLVGNLRVEIDDQPTPAEWIAAGARRG